MTETEEFRERDIEALYGIPSYVGLAEDGGNELIIGTDLGKVIESIRKAVKQKTSRRAGGQWEEGLESFRVYGSIQRQLEDLLSAPEIDDFGKVRPAESAVRLAKNRLFKMAEGRILPIPEDISTDSEGAIRISWRNGGRFLELVFPYETNLRPFIYYSEQTLFDISEDMSDRKLCGWAAWVEGGPRPE